MTTEPLIEKDLEDEGWIIDIKPQRGLLSINFKELWRYKDLILLLIRRDFVTYYKQTVLGPVWFIIQPLLTTIMFTIVFGNIAGISTDGLPKILFYMSGVVCWQYFSQCLTVTSQTFITNANIFGKVYFPRLASPIAVVIFNLITFSVQFTFLCIICIIYYLRGYPIHPSPNLLLLPILIIILAGLGLGFGIIISSLTTKYKDLVYLVTFGVQLWMYASPVVYPLSSLSGNYRNAILANPLTSIIETFRYCILGSGTFEPTFLLYSAFIMIIILTIGVIIFNRVERTFMDTI